MPNRCCVPGCQTGYGNKKIPRNVHIFRIPESDFKTFENAIPRANFTISHSTRICSRHFLSSCLDYTSNDSNQSRLASSTCSTLKNPRLKAGSVPTLFPNCPSYLSKTTPTPRTTAASTRNVEQPELPAVSEVIDSLNENDRIETLKSIVDHNDLTSNSSFILRDDKLTIYIHDEQHHRILGRMEISRDLTFTAYILDSVIPAEEFSHLLCTCGQITYFTELSNCVVVMKNKTEFLDSGAHKKLFDGMKSIHNDVDDDFVNFILEQLQLKCISPNRRRYSTQLYAYAYFWRSASSSCYKQLCEVLCLPTIKTLNRLSSTVPSDSNREYLSVRCQHLSDEEKTCILLIDEVYTAEKVELNAAGQLVGQTEAGESAKTVLAFMAKSLRSSFSEMISLIPVRNLTGIELKSHFDQVMVLLKDLLFIQVVSVDNHAINRTLYSLIRASEDEEIPSIVEHPNYPDEKLFLLFDSTHNLKNVFNNFHVRQVFRYPTLDGNSIDKACFRDLVSIYKNESGQSLRRAHKLTKDILNPSSTSKVSPKHALGKS